MRKVHLNMKELEKYNIIKKLVETNGNKKRAAVKLGCSIRTINRLIQKYNQEGKNGFRHKNKGRHPSNMYDEQLKETIIELYISFFQDANIRHFTQIVNEDFGLHLSSETVRIWLLKRDVLSPKAQRRSKKKLKKKLREDLKKASCKKQSNPIKQKIEEIDKNSAHPRRPRCKYFGEMIQMDASEYYWIPQEKWHLHLAVDDASGETVGAYFDYQETLNGYYHVFYQILAKYGIPASFYTDRRTVFEYRRKSRVFDNEDTFTQFSYSCHKLGVEIKTTSVPQAKGRIERLNQSFQSRLPIELRRANVTTIEEANIFLESYLPKYNAEFSLQLNSTQSVFSSQPSIRDINNYLAVRSVRTIDHGHTVHYKKKVYIPSTKNGHVIALPEGTKVVMIETFDKKLMMNVFDDLCYAKEIPAHSERSDVFDISEEEHFSKLAWNLPKKYNWRTSDFLGFLSKQKHRKDNSSSLC